jgi:hypothetical protein
VQFSVWGASVVWLIDMGGGEVDLKPGLKMAATGVSWTADVVKTVERVESLVFRLLHILIL